MAEVVVTLPRAPLLFSVLLADDWYERAKKATDRCDLELTKQWQGASKGLDDKVRGFDASNTGWLPTSGLRPVSGIVGNAS